MWKSSGRAPSLRGLPWHYERNKNNDSDLQKVTVNQPVTSFT